MADIIKLADTFLADRAAVIVLDPSEVMSVLTALRRVKLQPRLMPDLISGNLAWQIAVPRKETAGSSVHNVLGPVLEPAKVRIIETRDRAVELMCPVQDPPAEPCRVGEKLGRCPECGDFISVIGPISCGVPEQFQMFIMHRHDSKGRLCAGTGMSASELRPQYDGT